MKVLPIIAGITVAFISILLWSTFISNNLLNKNARTLIPSEYLSTEGKNDGHSLVSGSYFVAYTVTGVMDESEVMLRERIFEFGKSNGWSNNEALGQIEMTKANSRAIIKVLNNDGTNPGPPYAYITVTHKSGHFIMPLLISLGLGLLVFAGMSSYKKNK